MPCRKIILVRVVIMLFVVFNLSICFWYIDRGIQNVYTVEKVDDLVRRQCFSDALAGMNLSRILTHYQTTSERKPFYHEFERPFPLIKLIPSPKCFVYFTSTSQEAQALPVNLSADCFRPNYFTRRHKTMIRNSLATLKEAFEGANLELIMDAGSLIGSWRYHGLIPYDDDIDFRISVEDKPKVRVLLERLAGRAVNRMVFEDTEPVNQHWKLGFGCAAQANLSTCLITVDFFFNWVNAAMATIRLQEPPQVYSYSVVYPLVDRPFEGLLFKAVHDYPRYFEATYPTSATLNTCLYYNHQANSSLCLTPSIDCSLLNHRYPHVAACTFSQGHLEFLIDKDTIAGVYFLPRRDYRGSDDNFTSRLHTSIRSRMRRLLHWTE